MSSDEPRDDTSPDSPERADPALPADPAQPADPALPADPTQPGQLDKPANADQAGPTPYADYGSPGVHPIPGPPTRWPSPGEAAAQMPAPPGSPSADPDTREPYPGDPAGRQLYPGDPAGRQPYPGDPAGRDPYPAGPPPPGPTYPGETYPAPPYLPGQPVYPDYPGAATPIARPGQVTAGVIMSWVGGGAFALLGLLLFALADNKDLLDGVEQQLGNQLNRDQATTIFRTLGVGLGAWGVAVIVFAVLAWSGKNWARIALTVMGGLYCASQVVGIVSGAVAGLPFLAYVVICVGLLWTREAGAWFATRPYGAGGGPRQPPPIVW